MRAGRVVGAVAMADGTGGAGSPRLTGESVNSGTAIETRIDWLAASIDLLAVLREQGWDGDERDTLDELNGTGTNATELALQVFAFLFAGTGMELAAEATKGRFYHWRVSIRAAGEHVGLIELGGVHTMRKDGTATARVELTGDGCTRYAVAGSGHAKRWLELRAKLESVSARLTRVDVAADDLVGLYPISMARQWYDEGAFDARGQRPKARLFDDFDSGEGKTLYVGSKSSEKQLRVYEKGRELGDPTSPWVRYEVQFAASNRKELPLDILRDPSSYLLGAYPVLRFIRAVAARIDVTSAANTATWKSARRHLRRQYGATLMFIVKNTPDPDACMRVIESLTTPRLPAWACKAAADQWPEIVAENSKRENTQ